MWKFNMDNNMLVKQLEGVGMRGAFLSHLSKIKSLTRPRKSKKGMAFGRPAYSLYYKLAWSVKSLCIHFAPSVWKGRAFRREAISNFPEYDEDVSVLVRAIKKYLSQKFGDWRIGYAFARLKTQFNDPNTTRGLEKEAIEKHKKTLGEGLPPVEPSYLIRVRNLVSRIIGDAKFDLDRVSSISAKACLEEGVANGGKKGVLRGLRRNAARRILVPDGLPAIIVTSDECSFCVLFWPGWRDFVLNGLATLHDHDREVEAVAVAGPLKARVITKESAAAWCLEPIRRGIWRCLRKYPTFQFTGEEVTAEAMQDFLDDYDRAGGYGDTWISGDYTAATDGFHPEIASAIMEEIAVVFIHWLSSNDRGFSTDEEDNTIRESIYLALSECMAGKTILYKDAEVNGGYDLVNQRRGQLMGNPMSFVVLCLYNYVVWHLAMEDFRQCRSYRVSRHVRINGDDICYKSTEPFFSFWARKCGENHMELNKQKSDVKKDRVSINSKYFKEDAHGQISKVFCWRVYDKEVPRAEADRMRDEELAGASHGTWLYRDGGVPAKRETKEEAEEIPANKDNSWFTWFLRSQVQELFGPFSSDDFRAWVSIHDSHI